MPTTITRTKLGVYYSAKIDALILVVASGFFILNEVYYRKNQKCVEYLTDESMEKLGFEWIGEI